jgi:6-phosphofructokinase
MKLLEEARGRLRIVHVPKTIDNDLDLPAYVDTFGFQTARHVGVEIVKNLMVDAKTTSRWYFVTAMGRKAGHLALGIGKAAGATLTLLPEEFSGRRIRLKTVVDTLAGAIIKRLSHGRRDGVAILAEGLVLSIDPADLAQVDEVEKDAHGHVRIDEVNISEILKAQVARGLKPFGLKATIVAKNIGYELRCADPIPSDMDYTRDLGYCAAKYLLSGGTGVMISMQAGNLVPIPFEKLVDPDTGRTKVRMVDTHSTRYAIARRYMIRLRRDDFDDAHELAKFAATGGPQPGRVLPGVQVPRRGRAAGAGAEPGQSRRVALQPALVTALRTAGPADAGAVTASSTPPTRSSASSSTATARARTRCAATWPRARSSSRRKTAGRPGASTSSSAATAGISGSWPSTRPSTARAWDAPWSRPRKSGSGARAAARGPSASWTCAPSCRPSIAAWAMRNGDGALPGSAQGHASVPLHPHVQAVDCRASRD